MLLVEEDLYNHNNRIFWDGWKSINYLEIIMDLARHTCSELDVRCNEVETGGHGMMGWGPAASTLKDMPVRTQHARF